MSTGQCWNEPLRCCCFFVLASCVSIRWHGESCEHRRAWPKCRPGAISSTLAPAAHSHGGWSGVAGGCRWPLHRWLQVQRHAWLIPKGLQSSGRHSSPFLLKAGGGGAESRAGDRLWSSKEPTGVEMSRFMPGYFSPYIHSWLLTFLTYLFPFSIFCSCESASFSKF